MAAHDYVLIDVFTDIPLTGNALAVFPDAHAIPPAGLGPIARELNLSETVFAYPAADGPTRLRIFTPAVELPFAGHPVLGAAFVLGARGGGDTLTLATQAGAVRIALERAGGPPAFGRMDQPLPAISSLPGPLEAELLAALGVPRAALPIELYDNGMRHAYVALDTPAAVAAVEPDMAALTRIAGAGERTPLGVSCFAPDHDRWTTRMFAPAVDVPEDPATGSAAGPLACHLARHGRIGFGEPIVIAQGAGLGRPSELHATVDGSPGRIERVEVGGAAVEVGTGVLRL